MAKEKELISQEIRKELETLIIDFKEELDGGNLREKVLALMPLFHHLRRLGKSLIPHETASSARDRLLHYFRQYPYQVIKGDELLVVSAIQEYARRIRELRVQFGWSIINGITAKEMAAEGEFPLVDIDVSAMKPDDYLLLSEENDQEASYRWNVANEIRKKKDGIRNKIIEFLKLNVGKPITGEELRYVSNNKTEWARRVRELRTEYGWPVTSKNSGRPDLPVGVYVLESLNQSPEHDRNIPDMVRGVVLRRDGYQCTQCAWNHDIWNPSDPRHLELHHVKEHAAGGANTADNLITLCTVCHDDIHRKR